MNNALVVLFIILLVLCFYISPFSLLQFNRKIIINDLDVNNTQPHSLHGLNQFKPHHSVNCPDGIDAVWLWVNGSDPTFIEQLNKYGNKGTESRYRDYNTLLYSIRSVYTFAPFIKNYYLVTMNQIPSFINTSSLHYNEYTLHLVDHKDIFPDSSVLPVFNSNAIEAMLHNIKNLSTCFLYFNDDMLLGSPLDPEHFIRDDGKYNVYNNNWESTINRKN
ncbi:Glycosyltransferase [Entamoeba marina]